MDCYEVQAALQACTIYALLYARYIKPIQAGGVLSVIKAIIVCVLSPVMTWLTHRTQDFGRHLHAIHDFRTPLGTDESDIRQEWILRESTRRSVHNRIDLLLPPY